MANRTTFTNDIGLPEELVPMLVDKTSACEYASIKRDGTPITVPVGTFPGENGSTIDIATGLAYPTKAERARKNPQVCLLYSDPKGSRVENPPIILVYGRATVRDANLQANTDRYVREGMARSKTFGRLPPFIIRRMTGYLARIWISVTPLKLLWWPNADMEKSPKQWNAPEGTIAPPSDPPPKPLLTLHKPLVAPSSDWKKDLNYAIDQLGTPILTVVNEDGYPVPFRVRSGSLHSDMVDLELLSAMPVEAKGRACLTFHTLQLKNGEMTRNDNMTFIGDVSLDGNGALFKVERRLGEIALRGGLKNTLSFFSIIRAMGKRVATEAERRGQPVPKVQLPVS